MKKIKQLFKWWFRHKGIDLLFTTSKATTIEIQKLQWIEEVLKCVIAIACGIFLFWAFDKLGNFLSSIEKLNDYSFNTEYLYSMFSIPLIFYAKNMLYAFDSCFVKAQISENCITVKRGFFFTKYDKLYLRDVNNIEYYRSLGGKLFGYGQVDFYAIGGILNLPYVKDSEHNFNIIKGIIKNIQNNQK